MKIKIQQIAKSANPRYLAFLPLMIAFAPISMSIESQNYFFLFALIPLVFLFYWMFITFNSPAIYVNFDDKIIKVVSSKSEIEYSISEVLNFAEIISLGGRHKYESGFTLYKLSFLNKKKKPLKFIIWNKEIEFQKNFGNLKYEIKILRSKRAKKAVNK